MPHKALILIAFIFLIARVQISFLSYLDFRYNKFLNLDAKVVAQYIKEGKRGQYYVLKLKTKTLTFYTTSREDLKNLLNETINLTIITNKVSFLDYLFTFYAPSFNLKLKPINKIEELIEKQHKDSEIINLYKALFLGEALEYETRQKLSTLGIAHLVALSGLHLGFISLFLYFLLSPFYSIFHKKFPYRNKFVDLGITILVIELLYLYFTNFPPSLIRAFVLEIILFLYAYYLQNPFSLKVLFVVFIVSLIIFGVKVFSLGYFLSIIGVFYIYLFFRYFKLSLINSILLSFYMFLVMFIISHSFFANFNFYQFLSPIVSILFTLFYPLTVFLHLIGFGEVFDNVVLEYLKLGENYHCIKIPFCFMLFFIALSIGAFFNKKLFYGINLIALFTIVFKIGEVFGKI